jgi:hypothetical protein
MKSYQDHHPIQDQGKAVPKSKRSTVDTPRKQLIGKPCGFPEYNVEHTYNKHVDLKGNRETRVILIRNASRAVTLKRQTRGPASQAKARRY